MPAQKNRSILTGLDQVIENNNEEMGLISLTSKVIPPEDIKENILTLPTGEHISITAQSITKYLKTSVCPNGAILVGGKMKLCSDKMFIEIFDKQEDVRRPKILLLKFTKIAKMTSKGDMEYSNKDALVSGFKFVSCGGGRIRFAMAIEGSYTRFDFGSVEISEVSRNR